MTFRYEDARKELKGRLEVTTTARKAESIGVAMVPKVWADQIMKSVRAAAAGESFTQVSGTTKGAKLANAEAGLHLLHPANDTLSFQLIRFPEKEFMDLVNALELLARKVRHGNWRLSLPEYNRLAEELINDFSEAFGMYTSKDVLFDRYMQNRPVRYDQRRKAMLNETHGWPTPADRKVVEKALEAKAKSSKATKGAN